MKKYTWSYTAILHDRKGKLKGRVEAVTGLEAQNIVIASNDLIKEVTVKLVRTGANK